MGKPENFLGGILKGQRGTCIGMSFLLSVEMCFFIESVFPFKNSTITENLHWDEPAKLYYGSQQPIILDHNKNESVNVE